MKDSGITALRKLADHLEAEGYLLTEQEHQTLRLTPKSSQILYRGQQVTMKQRKEQEEPKVPATGAPAPHLAEEDRELYDVLRNLRSTLAEQSNIPAFVVFSNATLTEMATQKPKTLSEFRRISGVGELKASWYGEAFTKAIRDYLQNEA
jgi:ATP-dependent DNA helicase RecQ